MKAFLLAAGLGTRFRPHTEKIPKPCLPFLGMPLYLHASFHLKPLVKTGLVDGLVVNTFHRPEFIEETIIKKPPFGLNCEFSREKDFIKGSGGGLKYAERLFDKKSPIILINSDEVFFPDSETFLLDALEFHNKRGNYATLVGIPYPGIGSSLSGLWSKNESLLSIGKQAHPDANLALHYTGYQILSPEVFDILFDHGECNIFYDGLVKMLGKKKIEVFKTQGRWFETGSLPKYLEAHALCMTDLKNSTLFQWHQMKEDYGFDLEFIPLSEANLIKPKTLKLSEEVRLSGFVVFCANSDGAPSGEIVLENCVLNSSDENWLNHKNELVV